MNGLVWKDLTMLKTGVLYIGIFAIVFCVLFSEGNVMCIICSVIFASLVGSSFAWDDQCGWDLYAVSAGIDRLTILRSKYVSATVFVTVGTVLGAVMSVALMTIGGSLDLAFVAVMALTGFVMGMTVSFVAIAVNYYTGSSVKAQYTSIAVLAGSIAVLVSLSISASEILGGGMMAVLGVMTLIMLAMLAMSYRVSVARYLPRDL